MTIGSPDPYGLLVERDLRSLSGQVGVADFVFRPMEVPKGNAQREIGDFLLWVGQTMAVVSVKARGPDGATGTPAREDRWTQKKIKAAHRQILGVARTLRAAGPGTLTLVSERGVEVPWDPTLVDQYLGVVLVETEEPDEQLAPPVLEGPVPTVAMLAADWRFLHEALPSTTAVLNYVAHRANVMPSCPLGSEPDLLALIVEQEGEDSLVLPEAGLARGYFDMVAQAHPDWFLTTDPNRRAALVVDVLIEAAADNDPDWTVLDDPLDYLHLTAFLDKIPLAHRVRIGQNALDRCERAGRDGGYNVGLVGLPHGLLVYMASAEDREVRSMRLRSLTLARHTQALDAGAPQQLVTVGVATEPLPSTGRSHDMVLIEGPLDIDDARRAQRDLLFEPPDFSVFVESWKNTLAAVGR